MARRGVWFFVLIVAVLSPIAARASSDGDCKPSWKIAGTGSNTCSNLAVLQPGNDTRANLLLLLAGQDDAQPAPVRSDEEEASKVLAEPSDWATFRSALYPPPSTGGNGLYAAGEGSRCRSNDAGTADFVMALRAEQGVTSAERDELIAARQGLRPDCSGAGAGREAVSAAAEHAQSPLAKDFAAYLSGAAAFYAGDFDAAARHFAALSRSTQPWLRESGRYLLGRVEVNHLQAGAFDEYGNLREVPQRDTGKATEAETGLQDYLTAYPNGRYATSARGLLRRVYWMSGANAKLLAEYERLVEQKASERGISDADLAQELDSKLLPLLGAEQVRSPVLLATLDLVRMRKGGTLSGEACCSKALTLEELNGQREFFAGKTDLFDYLVASYQFHVARQPRAVLGLLPDRAQQKSYGNLEFSRQVLRGLALDSVKDRNARGFWLDLIQGASPVSQRLVIELALALHDERAGTPEHIFEPASPVRNETIRQTLLRYSAGPQLLRRQAGDAAASPAERATALYTLLYRDLTRGAYKAFPGDVALVPADAKVETDPGDARGDDPPSSDLFVKPQTASDFTCPDLKSSVATLSANQRDITGRLCLGEFIRLNDLDRAFLDTPPAKDELGGKGVQFPGRKFSRLDTYRTVIGAAGATSDQKAYALYRAVWCFAPTGKNGCDDSEVPAAQRKAWFKALKRDYPQSRWAQSLEYYW
ncbi:tol-pal system YbgF family protein [Labrys sp. KB_33_2]|uniref:tetratricopeptide repeat protein n=1 Tax=Labrys sp. KB_33_2 TaxID=3237479 RepID=UPI003F910491